MMKFLLIALFLLMVASVKAMPNPEEGTQPDINEDELEELEFEEDDELNEGDEDGEEDVDGEEFLGDPVTIDRKREIKRSMIKRASEGFDLNSDQGAAGGCTDEWEELENSTMCAFTDDPGATDLGITAADKQLILEKHNEFRSQIEASNIVKMYWDANLAEVAQKLAQSCYKTHDTSTNRFIPGYNIYVGQNICGGISSWLSCITAWYMEKEDFTYGEATTKMIGHFTQVVMHDAIAIGCGYAKCPGANGRQVPFYYCNYAYGQTKGDLKTPYQLGNHCDACPDNCKDNLCDCGDKLCLNGGSLNLLTCTCKCGAPFYGDHCESINCPAKDHKSCGGGKYVYENCHKYSNLKKYCPYECRLC